MKALCIFSGGLDSLCSAALLRSQGVEVLALFFETPFFGSGRARESARRIGLPLKVVDLTEPHLAMLKNPRHGYGGHMNPCIDCHALMLRTAGRMLAAEGAGFVISGEVLGQRPMSQNRGALDLVARESGLGRLLLRPLSAKALPPTIPEEKGWVNRELLMGFRGRSRKPQMALARDLGITLYPAPAGGCLLTETVFSARLKDLLNARQDPPVGDIELLKVGRHFRLDSRSKLVVGRNQPENQRIESLAAPADAVLRTVDVPGPTALLQGDPSEDNLAIAAALTAAYSDARTGEPVRISIAGGRGTQERTVPAPDKLGFRSLMIG